MEYVKKFFLLVVGGLMSIMCLSGIAVLVVLLKYADFQKGKAIVVTIFVFLIGAFGLTAYKCFRRVLHKEKALQFPKQTISVREEILQDSTIEQSTAEAVSSLEPESVSAVEAENTPQEVPEVSQAVSLITATSMQENVRENIELMSEYILHRPMTESIRTFDTQDQDKIQSKTINRGNAFDKKVSKCNCDGCLKQCTCEYGHVVYDDITKKRMSLFDKFMMVIMNSSGSINITSESFGIIATNEELHNKKLLLKLDKNILHNTLNYLETLKKEYINFGKCGRAYFNFMKMGDEISLVKEAIREYEEYQIVLKQMDLVQLYVLDRINKDDEFQQEEIYKIFPDVERKYITTVVREMEKASSINREKGGKSYIIRKNNA